MSDLYQEHLVKKERTAKDSLKKNGMIALVVIAAVIGVLFQPLVLIAALVLGIVAYYLVIPSTDLEYEYLFVNGELDIDKIMAKSKRKKVKTLNLSDADLMAPLKSHRMDYYNGSQSLKTLDFSSGKEENKRYAIIIRDKGENCRVIVEPDEPMLDAMRRYAPSKVFLD